MLRPFIFISLSFIHRSSLGYFLHRWKNIARTTCVGQQKETKKITSVNQLSNFSSSLMKLWVCMMQVKRLCSKTSFVKHATIFFFLVSWCSVSQFKKKNNKMSINLRNITKFPWDLKSHVNEPSPWLLFQMKPCLDSHWFTLKL